MVINYFANVVKCGSVVLKILFEMLYRLTPNNKKRGGKAID